jgi:hypothetical protein
MKIFNKVTILIVLASLFIFASCGSREKDILGKWSPDLGSIDLKLGDGIPADIKSEVEQEMSGVKAMQFMMDQIIIEFKEEGVLTLGPTGDTRDFNWKLDGNNLVLSGELEGLKADFSLEIKELSKEKMTLFISAEAMMEQAKKAMGSEFDEAMAEIPAEVNVNDMVKGTSMAITLTKKS